MFKTLGVRTRGRNEVLDISGEVAAVVRESGVKEGLCVVFVPHTTAGVTINENADPDVKRDMVAKLEAMVPEREDYYRHGEGNSDAHIKTALVGPSITMIVDGGELVLGTWQGIYFCEFDGPRQRECHVKVLKG
jgi:secondary thiamine-phosphate synthase enzyme